MEVGSDRILFHPRLGDIPTNMDRDVEIYCPSTDGGTSEQSNRTVSIHIDTIRPVITPGNATIYLELGSTHTPETPACADTNPDADLTGRITTEDGGLAAALSGSANTTATITHSCVDEAGNPARQSVRTFEIRDTMSPTISFSHAILEVAFGGTYAAPVATCNDPPRGTFTTTNDGQTVDTDTAGTYTESYTCDDGLTQATTGTRTVTVLAAGAGSDPVIGNVPTEPILFRQGTEPPAHGLTCDDGGVDLTSRITTLTPVDSTATNGTLDVEYTCTDDDSTTARATVTYHVDGTVPEIDPPTGARNLELGEPFPETAACTDPFPRGAATLAPIDASAIEAALDARMLPDGPLSITYECTDRVGNAADPSVRTFTIVDTTPPGDPVIGMPLIDRTAALVFELGTRECPQDRGTPSFLMNTTTRGGEAARFDSTVPGEYVITYYCMDASQRSGTVAQQVTVEKGMGYGTAPVITLGPLEDMILVRLGDPAPAHGLTCTDGDIDRTAEIMVEGADLDTSVGGVQTVTYICRDDESMFDRSTITYTVDGTRPAISPGNGTIQLELGSAFAREEVTCTDPFPAGEVDQNRITRQMEDVVDAALASRAPQDVEVTYDCTDEAGNPARQSVRMFAVNDTTAPAPPVIPSPMITITQGSPLDLGRTTCPDDRGTPISISNTTTRDGAAVDRVDPDAPGTYIITFRCSDLYRSTTAQQTVTVNARAGSGDVPVITGKPAGPLHTRQGAALMDHGMTCRDGTADLPLTPNPAIPSGDVNGTTLVTFTCTDADGNPASETVTYIVDGTRPVIDPGNGTITLELGGTFAPESPTCTDRYPRADRTSDISRDGEDDVRTALGSKEEGEAVVTYSCSDAVGNPAKISERTFDIQDTIRPAPPTFGITSRTVDQGDDNPLDRAACAQDGGTVIRLMNTTTRDNAAVDGIDTGIPGTYRVDHWCEDANQRSETARQTLMVRAAPGHGTPPVISGTPLTILVREGEDPDPHGLVCLDGGADLSGRITTETTVDSTTRNGTHEIVYTCTDDEEMTATAAVTYIVDGTFPVITPGDGPAPADQELGTAFVPETVTCADRFPMADRTSNITRSGEAEINLALSSKEPVRLTLTHICHDEAGNRVTSERIHAINDTIAPGAPTASVITRDIPHGGDNPLDMAVCAQDAGTAVQLVREIRLDGELVDEIDTDDSGTYVVENRCADRYNTGGSLRQTLNVMQAAKPVLTLAADARHLRSGDTYAPELSCAGTITANDTASALVDGRHVVTVPEIDGDGMLNIMYSCESSGRMADEMPVLRITVDNTLPQIEILGDDPHHVKRTAGQTYDSVDAGTTCTDAAPGVKAGESSNATEASLDADAELTVAYHCWDLAGNNATAYRQVIVDGTRPVITPVNATIHLELGSTHTDMAPTCTDPFPPTDLTDRITTEDGGLAAALSGSANDTVRITHSCIDEVGNPARQSVRTFEIRDTMSPTISFSHAILEVAFGGTYVEPVATCSDPPRGTFTTTNDGQTVDTDTAGTYTESYTCDDGLTQAATETRTVTVLAAGAGSNPVIGNVPTAPILFREGTTPPAHGLTCDDGGVDLTSRITTLTPVDSTATNGTLDVEYTCTDDDSTTARATVTYHVDGTIPVIDPPTGTVPGHQELGTAFSAGETATCKDSFPKADRTVTTAGQPAIETALEAGEEDELALTHSCTDEAGNEAVQSVRTYELRDTIAPAAPSAAVTTGTINRGDPNPLTPPTCAPDGGTPLEISTVVTRDGSTVSAVDTNVAGMYEVTSKCTDANRDGPTLEQTLTVNADPAPSSGPALTGTASTPAYLRDATTYEHGITCTEGGTDLTSMIGFDPALSTLTEERVHEVTLYCPATSGDTSDYANATISITVDRTGPVADIDGTRNIETHAYGSAYTYRSITCPQDAGSPVQSPATVTYVDAGGAALPGGIAATTEAGQYGIKFHCTDEAGNQGPVYTVPLIVYAGLPSFNDDATSSRSVLNGTLGDDARMSNPLTFDHGLECRPEGKGTDVKPGKLVFRPLLATLEHNRPTPVDVFCLDINGNAGPDAQTSGTVTFDTHPPTLARIPGGSVYFEQGPHHTVPTGVIHPIYESNKLESRADIKAKFRCVDSPDARSENAVEVHTKAEITRKEFDYQRLGDKITPQFVAAHTRDGVTEFDVLDVTCTDLAGNERIYSWIIAEDRAYHPAEGQKATVAPVIEIHKFVSEAQAGPYTHPEGDITCSDYLAADLSTNDYAKPDERFSDIGLDFRDVPFGGGSESTRFLSTVPSVATGLTHVPHVCTDAAGARVATFTNVFVPAAGGPTISIMNDGAEVEIGQRIPVTASCTDESGSPLEVENRTYSRFYSTHHQVTFDPNPDDTSIERQFHIVFWCKDSSNREALKSGTFTQVPGGPQVRIEGSDLLFGDRITPESAIRNAHLAGEAYTAPEATCYYPKNDPPTWDPTVSGGPGAGTAAGTWSTITYECTAGSATELAELKVRTLNSKEITFDPGRDAHRTGTSFADNAACTGTRGQAITPVVETVRDVDGNTVPAITDSDGRHVARIDASTPAGNYTILYECTDTKVLKGKGGPAHLKEYELKQVFTRPLVVADDAPLPVREGLNIEVHPAKYAPLVTLPTQNNFPTATCRNGDDVIGVLGLSVIFGVVTSDKRQVAGSATIDPEYVPASRLTLENWNKTYAVTFTCRSGGERLAPETTEFHQVAHNSAIIGGFEIDGATETQASAAANLHLQGTAYEHGEIGCGIFSGDRNSGQFNTYEFGEAGSNFRVHSGGIDADTPLAALHQLSYTCQPPGADNPRIVTRQVPVVERLVPVIENLGTTEYELGEAYEETATCSGLFGGAITGANAPAAPVLDVTVRGGTTVGAITAAGDYTLDYTCTQQFLGQTFTAAPASRTLEVKAAGAGTPPTSRLTGDAPEVVELKSGTDYRHDLSCTDGGTPKGIEFSPRLEDLTANENNTVTIICPDDRNRKSSLNTRTVYIYVDTIAPRLHALLSGRLQYASASELSFPYSSFTCADDRDPTNTQALFDPPVRTIANDDPTTATIYCPDAVGNTLPPGYTDSMTPPGRTNEGNATVIIHIDTKKPVVTVTPRGTADNPTQVPFGGPYVQPTVTCVDPDGGTLDTPVATNTGETVDVNTPGTYTETYTGCLDRLHKRSDPVDNVVRVLPDTASTNMPPRIVLDYTNNTNLEVGNDATATCTDTEDGDKPVTRTGGAGFDPNDDTFGYAEGSRAKPYAFTYTCTDTGSKTATARGVITQVSDIPHLIIPGIIYDAAGKQTFASVQNSFHSSGNTPTFDDSRCYHHTTGEFLRDNDKITINSGGVTGDALRDLVGGNLGAHVINHTCAIDGKSNSIFQTIYTISRERPAITISPASPVTHTEGTEFDEQSTCTGTLDGDLDVDIVSITGPGSPSEIDETTAPGQYTITYSCTEDFPATDFHLEGSISSAQGTLVVNVEARAADAPTTTLTGKADKRVHIMTATEAEFETKQGIGCDNTVSGGPTEIFYIPEITSLAPNMQHTVRAYCPDGDGRVSDATNGTFRITVDNMDPTASISGSDPHVLMPVAGATYDSVDEGAICSDNPPGSVVSHTVKSASGSTSIAADTKFTATATCTDQAGNTGPVSWQVIIDGTAPAAPTAPATLMLNTNAVPDLDADRPACAQDSGSRVTTPAAYVIKLAGVEVMSIDTTSATEDYTIEYTCRDAATNESAVATRAVSITRPATDTRPDLMLDGNNTTFEVGTDAPGATCTDVEDGTFDAVRTDPAGYDINEDSFGFAEGSRAIEYRFDFTCTDSDGRTDTGHAIHTQVSNVPHLAITGINYGADGKQTFESLTFHRSGNNPSFDDAKCYFHTTGEFKALDNRIVITGEDDEGVPKNNDMSTELQDSIRLNLGWHLITHTCTIEPGKSNSISQTIYTIARDNPVINTGPAEVIHPLGDTFEHAARCTSVLDEAIEMEDPDIVDAGGVTVARIDGSTPAGTYTATYSCTQEIPENANHLEGTLTAAQRSVMIVVSDGVGPDLRVPSGRVIHEQGAAFDVNDHATCTDGSGTMDISIDPVIDASTQADTYETIISCTDGTNTRTAPLTVVVRAPGMPVITPPGDSYHLQHFFEVPGATCTDPEEGLLETTHVITDAAGTVIPEADVDRGRHLVTYSCTDSAGNEAEPANATIHVGRAGDTLPPVITMAGYSVIYHQLGTPYVDRGATCHDDNYGDLPVAVATPDGPVDYNRIGTYRIAYSCQTPQDGDVTATRYVRIVSSVPADSAAPMVDLPQEIERIVSGAAATAPPPGIIDRDGNAVYVPAPDPGSEPAHERSIRHAAGTPFTPPRGICNDGDDEDGNRIYALANHTHSITEATPAGSTEDVTYTCKDPAGNTVTRTLHVMVEEDAAAPRIALIGPGTVTMAPGAQYVERGATCTDGFTPPGTQLLPRISGDRVLSRPGSYDLEYVCVDASGHASPILGRTILVRSDGSGEEDWLLNPTFGRSWITDGQQVRGGFAFNGRSLDITDNFHTGLERMTVRVGSDNTITMKAYSERDLERFTIYLGVPDVSRATAADAAIHVDLRRDYMVPAQYIVASVSHDQAMPLVQPNSTAASVSAARCGAGDAECTVVEVSFRVMAPLSSDIVAIAAMDTERRFTVSYVNDGVRFDGASMLPAETASFVIKRGNQHPAEWVHLVREDWRYNLWEDQHGFAWVRNSYGSWEQVTRAGFERLADPEVSIVTRNHDRFADMLERERERAALVFNATELEREVGGSFSHDAPVRVEKLKDPAILEKLKIEELAALEYLEGAR